MNKCAKIFSLQTVKDTKPSASTEGELTIPLMLPKINARSHTTAPAASNTSSPTIPLNLPKGKSRFSASNSPTNQNTSTLNKTVPPQRLKESDKGTSVLSSLSEEDLIRKAAEMLGETEDDSANKKPNATKESNAYSPTPSYKPPVGHSTSFTSGPIVYTPPPNLVPPSPLMSKSSKLDLSQPPIPGLED